ncbi:MAG TPA: TOBE domain-containing protein, partial [Fibrobacteria bacterium]|nr:TOBE domain-containing protein [Fibrobacteria bacterium]
MSVPHTTTKLSPRIPSAATTIPRCRAISPTPRRLLFSHRNQWKVAVESIQRGFLEESVTLRLPSGSRMVAQVPLSTGSLLGICPGRLFSALVDPMAVLLEAGPHHPVVSCCNCLEAT